MPSGGRSRDIEQLVREARRQGWRIERTAGRRYMMWSPKGDGPVFASSTPSDPNALKNIVRALRRLGFIWKGR